MKVFKIVDVTLIYTGTISHWEVQASNNSYFRVKSAVIQSESIQVLECCSIPSAGEGGGIIWHVTRPMVKMLIGNPCLCMHFLYEILWKHEPGKTAKAVFRSDLTRIKSLLACMHLAN